MAYEYIRDPAEIYRLSFDTVEREADLSAFDPKQKRIVTRLIHSCGMIDIAEDFACSTGAVDAGLAALKNGCAVNCDVEMVKAGIIERNMPGATHLVCTLNDPRASLKGKTSKDTRSAAAVEFWDKLEGSICVIGNAPTALFRLLERVEAGAGKPALVIGIPVGFIGSAESKVALATNELGIDYITVHGRRGGSAMASSVVNALVFLSKEST